MSPLMPMKKGLNFQFSFWLCYVISKPEFCFANLIYFAIVFTLPQTFLRWTYFRVIHLWTSIDYVTLSLIDITGKQTSLLVVKTFVWRHIMTTAVESNGQMRWLVTVVYPLHKTVWKKMCRTVVKNVNTRGPSVLYRSPYSWGYVKISGYWGKEILTVSDLDQGQWLTLTFGTHKALI